MRTCGRCSKAGSPPCCSAVRPGGRATGWPGAWTASGLEVRDQELLHGLVELELVLVVVKAVALVVLDHVLHLDAALAQRLHHLVALVLVHARKIGRASCRERV